MSDNPFISGARVAVRDRYTDSYSEGFVDKTYKNGNFVLRGSSQQWRPRRPTIYSAVWRADETGGSGYRQRTLDIWDATIDAGIQDAISKANRRKRWEKIKERVRNIRPDDITDEILAIIEPALPAAEQTK